MKMFIVSPSRSISKAFPSADAAGAGQEFFLDMKTAEYVRDRWNKRYGIGGFWCEVYEVEARITRKVACPSRVGP